MPISENIWGEICSCHSPPYPSLSSANKGEEGLRPDIIRSIQAFPLIISPRPNCVLQQKLTSLLFSDRLPCGPFLIIHVLPVPHPLWPPIQQRPFLAALTIVNLHLEMHMCVCNFVQKIHVCIFSSNFCIVYLYQPHMCISTELLQMRVHLYVTSYLTKCDGSLPPPALGFFCPNCALNKWIFSIAFNLPIGGLISCSVDWFGHPNVSAQLTDWVINQPIGEHSNIELLPIAKKYFVIL